MGDQIERVVVAGHPTLSRPVTSLLGKADVEVISLTARGRVGQATVPGQLASSIGSTANSPMTPRGWTRGGPQIVAVSRRLDELLAAEPELTPSRRSPGP